MNDTALIHIMQEANDIYRRLKISQLLGTGIVQMQLDYTNYYQYYKLPQHEVKIFWINSFKHLTQYNHIKSGHLYVGIPFCNNSCTYCYSQSRLREKKEEVKRRYIAYLVKELTILGRHVDLKSIKIKYVYFGGGTPTCLQAEQLIEFTDYIRRIFTIDSRLQLSIESDPNSLLGDTGIRKLKKLKENGFTRISIGIQDFHDTTLKLVGRKHSAERSKEAFYNACSEGFKNINLDLMLGLPGQTPTGWHTTIEEACRLGPESIDIYQLRFYGFNMIYQLFITRPDLFPSEKEIIIMRIIAKELLTRAGYEEVYPGLFQKSDNLKAHPFASAKKQIIALGVNGRGQINNVRYYNEADDGYIRKLDKNSLPLKKIFSLNRRQYMVNDIIYGLNDFQSGFSKGKFNNTFGVDIERQFGTEVSLLKRYGLVSDNGNLKLTYKGTIFANDVYKFLCRERFIEKAALWLTYPQIRRTLFPWVWFFRKRLKKVYGRLLL